MKDRGEILGVSPAQEARWARWPQMPEPREEDLTVLRAMGVERVLQANPAWRDPSYNPSQLQLTVNPPVLSGRYYGFRIEPYSVLGNVSFQLPRTIITKGLSRQEGGDGETKVWPIATKSWYPHAFSSLAFGLEAAGATATDGPWEVWGAETPDAMLVNIGELLSTGYVRDGTSGLWTSPAQTPIAPNPQPVVETGFQTAKPVNILSVAAANSFSLGPLTLASPFDKIFGIFTFSTAGAVSSGITLGLTIGATAYQIFGPTIAAAVTTVTYYISWGLGGSSGFLGGSAGAEANSGYTISIPGTPTPGFTLALSPAGITAGSVAASIWKTY